MRWKLALLAVVAALLIALCTFPVTTMTIQVDLPPGVENVSAAKVQKIAYFVIVAVDFAIVGGIIAVSAWIASRIMRGRRR